VIAGVASLPHIGIVAHWQLVATTREPEISNDVGWHVAGLSHTNKNGDVHALGHALEIWKRVNGEWNCTGG
jgi:hypothetical protein